jgi:hypothetical protein
VKHKIAQRQFELIYAIKCGNLAHLQAWVRMHTSGSLLLDPVNPLKSTDLLHMLRESWACCQWECFDVIVSLVQVYYRASCPNLLEASLHTACMYERPDAVARLVEAGAQLRSSASPVVWRWLATQPELVRLMAKKALSLEVL